MISPFIVIIIRYFFLFCFVFCLFVCLFFVSFCFSLPCFVCVCILLLYLIVADLNRPIV